jgi:hypothetical protein
MRLAKIIGCIIRKGARGIIFTAALVAGCGGGEGASEVPSRNIDWVSVTAASSSTTAASFSGTAWISQNYYASHCVGIACVFDTTRTDDYPGVDVTYINLATGVSGKANSYYGPGSDWIHQWRADIPVISGTNAIQISAYDPSGKGGYVTVNVVPPTPLNVLSTSPMVNATGVMVNSTISATFSDQIDPPYSNFTVSGPTGSVAGSRTVNGSTVTFTPQSYLAYSATYTVTLSTSIRSPSGSSLTSEYSWSFTTNGPPLFNVQSTYPAAGASNVPTYSTLPYVSVTFNQPLSAMTVSNSSFFVSSPSGPLIGTFSVNGSSLALWYNYYLAPNTIYTATLTTAISDTGAHTLPFDYVWTFATGN